MKLPTFADPESLSYVYTLLQSSFDQMNDPNNNNNNNNNNNYNSNNSSATSVNTRKRRRKVKDDDDVGGDEIPSNNREEEEGDNKSKNKKEELKGILTSLLLLDEQEKVEQDHQIKDSEDEKFSLETNHKKKTKAMIQYYTNLDDYYGQVEESERVQRKKSRNMANSVAVAAAGGSEALELEEGNGEGVVKSGGGGGGGPQRRLWVKDRSGAWWDECNTPDFPEEEFKKAFRMGRSTFDLICEELNSAIVKEDTTLRNAILLAIEINCLVERDAMTVPQRRLWEKDRSGAWWDECNTPDFPEEEFKKAFRMGRSTFDLICEELNSAIMEEDTPLRNTTIPLRQRVAVCLWRLATGDPLRIMSKRFGLGISTCHNLVLEVCTAIKEVLMPKYLQWPYEAAALRKIKDDFESVSGIPNVVGSMYTSNVPIIAPKISVANYFNKRHTERKQKTSYSITVQGVVDSRGVFTDVCIGWPGSMSDDQVVERSALSQRANAREDWGGSEGCEGRVRETKREVELLALSSGHVVCCTTFVR